MYVNSLSLPIFDGYPFIFFKLVNQFNPLARELIFGRCAFAAFENTLTRLLNRLCRILFLHRHRPFQNSVCDTACSILLQNREMDIKRTADVIRSTGISPRPMFLGAPRNAVWAFNAGVSLAYAPLLMSCQWSASEWRNREMI